MNQNSIDQLLTRDAAATQASFMTKVYGWMTLALSLTGITALYTASNPELIAAIFGSRFGFLALIIGTFLLVGWLVFAIRKMSPITATLVFLGYSVLNGFLFSSIFMVYTSASIALTFFITAGTFAAMSVYGYFTKTDLSSIGNIAIMALFGVIIASLVNMFMQNETLYWIISYVGVAIFVALVAYDTQKIKNIAIRGFDQDGGAVAEKKASIMGALTLYLDFINLFLYLLRLFGRRN
jgi:FtsH-binding integral membrane protein